MRAAILGVGMTMQGGLYEKPLAQAGIGFLVPAKKEQESMHRIIMEEIIPGTVQPASVEALVTLLERMAAAPFSAAPSCPSCWAITTLLFPRSIPPVYSRSERWRMP